MKEGFRVLARELAVEEIEAVAGAYTGPGDDGNSTSIGDNGSGCTTADESWFTVYDDSTQAMQ